VLSIVFFQPKIASLLNTENPLINWLWNLLAVSIAAQIGTFPISIYYFHQFPTYFWISNFIVIPAAAFLLYSSFLFFSTLFIPFLSKSIAWLISFGIKGMNFGISSIESLPGAVIENIWMNEMSLIIYLLLILSIANLTVNKKFCNIYPSLFLLILLIINTSIQTYTIRTQKVIIFYNNYSEDLISFIDGNSHYYYSISDSISSNSQRLLKNSSRYYSTQNSIALNKRMKNQNDLRIYRNSIFFKNCIVRLENVNSKYINSTTNDEIIWIPHNSTLIIKENNLFELWILKNSKLKKMTQNEGKIKYKTHNNSALTATIN
jgi:hypothetical protein